MKSPLSLVTSLIFSIATLSMVSMAQATDLAKTCGSSFSANSTAASKGPVISVDVVKIGSPRKDMAPLFTFLESADPNNSKLTWNDFNILEKATLALEANHNKIESSLDYKDLFIYELRELQRSQRGAFNKKENSLSVEQYSNLPLARAGLMQSYRLKFNRLLSLLPAPYNKPLQIFPDLNKKVKYVNQAKELMKELAERYEQIFATTGFSTIQEFEAYINSNEADNEESIANIRRELSALDKNEYEFAMRRPEGARFWLTNGSGFQNQRETGGSSGFYDPDARDLTEAKGLGLEKGSYVSLDDDIKPVYGYLSPTINALKSSDHSALGIHYGSDIYYFKKKKVKDLVSYMHTDSLGQTVSSRVEWNTLFIPWRFRSLISPAQILVSGRQSLIPLDFKIKNLMASGGVYIELQFWGPIGLEDVDTLVFEKTPPSGEYLEKLRQLNIKIYDGRRKPIRLWNGVD